MKKYLKLGVFRTISLVSWLITMQTFNIMTLLISEIWVILVLKGKRSTTLPTGWSNRPSGLQKLKRFARFYGLNLCTLCQKFDRLWAATFWDIVTFNLASIILKFAAPPGNTQELKKIHLTKLIASRVTLIFDLPNDQIAVLKMAQCLHAHYTHVV